MSLVEYFEKLKTPETARRYFLVTTQKDIDAGRMTTFDIFPTIELAEAELQVRKFRAATLNYKIYELKPI